MSILLQFTVELHVPKQFHRMILGKGANNIKQLEQSSNTKITVPRSDDSSDIIRISGNKEGVEVAKRQIKSLSDDLVCVCEMCLCVCVKYVNAVS